jgi:CheY-like chemotaxis protein
VVLSVHRVARARVGTLPGHWPVQGFALANSEHDEFLEIRVSDTGIGISRENMARLFQAFSQIDSSLARKFAGTGLGLAMVKQLAELHNGTVAVSSAEGEGACFAVWLPLLATPPLAQVSTTSNGAAPQAVAVRRERMALVVEDNDKAADLVRLLLEAEGFTVLHAPSGEAALVMAPMQTLSLVTLDLELPGMDGWEFLLKMRESANLAHLPVVIIAGVADSNVALSRGAVAAMQKPISRADLKATLAGLGLQPGESRTRTVLVVDDDPKAVEVIAAFLPTPAYAVLRAYGGDDAIALAQRVKPDLILLDLTMPETNGIDVVDALYRNPDTAHIPIVVITASPISADDRAALDGYPGKEVRVIEKLEFGHDRFVDEVRRALPQS